MTKHRSPEREDRITMEIVVDAYDSEERAITFEKEGRSRRGVDGVFRGMSA